jgi:hypothetical protein
MTTFLTPEQATMAAGVLSFLFTVALLSYLIGDNPLYRVALHLFVGVSIGYGTLVVIYQVLRPRLIEPLTSGDPTLVLLTVVPLVLFIFLILKLGPRTAAVGNVGVAFLIGVGTGVATGGALTGTLIPQIRATWLSVSPPSVGDLLNNLVIIAGAATTLLAFQFWLGRGEGRATRGPTVMRLLRGVGRAFMIVALGVVYGGAILSGIAVLSERLGTLAETAAALIR